MKHPVIAILMAAGILTGGALVYSGLTEEPKESVATNKAEKVESFKPTERIPPEQAVDFPVDI